MKRLEISAITHYAGGSMDTCPAKIGGAEDLPGASIRTWFPSCWPPSSFRILCFGCTLSVFSVKEQGQEYRRYSSTAHPVVLLLSGCVCGSIAQFGCSFSLSSFWICVALGLVRFTVFWPPHAEYTIPYGWQVHLLSERLHC